VFSLVAVVYATGLLFGKMAEEKQKVVDKVHTEVQPLQQKSTKFKKEYSDLQKSRGDLEKIGGWLDERYAWGDILNELRQVLMRVEMGTKSARRTDAGIWIENMTTIAPRVEGEGMAPMVGAGPESSPGGYGGMSMAQAAAFRKRYGLGPMGGAPTPAPAEPAAPAADGTPADGSTPSKPKNTNELATFTVTFRAVSLASDAKKQMVYSVIDEIKASPSGLFDPEETKPSGNVSEDEPPGTFTFGITVGLKHPIKL
jgi:hypothetical protein